MLFLTGAMVLVAVIAIVAIPGEIRALIIRNCCGPSGWPKPTYVCREIFAVAGFFAGALLVAAIVATLGMLVVGQIGHHLIPLDMVRSAANHADVDPAVVKENLTTGPDSVSLQHERWYVAKGNTPQDARDLQELMVQMVPFAIPVVFGILLLTLQMTSKTYDYAIKRLLREEVRRTECRLRESYLN